MRCIEVMSGEVSVEKRANKQILIGSIIGYIAIAINILSGLLFTPWIIENLGQSQYGLFTLTNSLISFLTIDFGLSTTVKSFLSKYRAENDEEGAKRVLGVFYKLYFIVDSILLVVFVVVYFLSPYIYQGLTPPEVEDFQNCFLIFACYALVMLPSYVFDGIIYSREQFIWDKALSIVQKALYIVFVSLSICFNWGLYAIVAINALSNITIIGIKYLLIRFKFKIKCSLRGEFSFKIAKPFLLYSFWTAIDSIAIHVSNSLAPSVLGIVSDSNNIALFGLITTFTYYVRLLGNIFGQIFLPKLARYYEEGEEVFRKKLLHLATSIGRIQLIVIAAIVMVFGCFGQEFVLIWMRGDTTFLPSYYGILLIIVTYLIELPEIILKSAMYTTNNVKFIAIGSIARIVVFVALSFVLSMYLGFFGAALSAFISSIVYLGILNYFYLKKLKISLKSFFVSTYVRIILSVLICLPVGLCLHFFLNFDSSSIYFTVLKFLIEASVVTLLYLVLIYLIGLTKSEKNVIKSKLFRKRKIKTQ